MKSLVQLSGSVSRRDFLRAAGAASAFTILPSWSADELPPSERVNLACCGCGGQGGQDINTLFGTGLANIVALCDVDANGTGATAMRKKFPEAKFYDDFRKMFDEMAGKIDAVLVGVPDHAHFPICMQAMALGKAVYCEKPLGHTFEENELLMAAAKKHKVVTQMGNQGHSGGNYFQFKAWSEAGIIKDVTHVDAYMNGARRWHKYGPITGYPEAEPMPEGMNWDVWAGTAEKLNFNKKFHPGDWRSWYVYGTGALGDWAPHILDTIHRFLDLGMPEEFSAVDRDGPNDFIFPTGTTLNFKFPARGEGKPAMDITWYDGVKNKIPLPPEMKGIKMDGTAGKVIYSKQHIFWGGHHSDILRIAPDEKMKAMAAELPKTASKNSNHYANFLLAVKGKEETRSPFSVAGPLSQLLNLGVIAQRLGGSFKFDRATKQIVGNEKANAMLKGPAPRKGWEQYYKL